MQDKFPTAYYETHGILTCPNGDKLRSDAEGLFCWIESSRIPVEIVNGTVQLSIEVLPTAPAASTATKTTKGKADADG